MTTKGPGDQKTSYSLSPRERQWWVELAIRGKIKCPWFLSYLIIHSNLPSISQKPGVLLLSICILTTWIAYWLFLLTTQTWTLNPIGNNYLSRAKKNKICVFSFHYRSACSWKNMYLSSFRHLAGDASNAVVISKPGWQIHVPVVKTNQGVFFRFPFFLFFFFFLFAFFHRFDSHT